ncbi:MAG: S24 family peptidase [Patescibacteria group bacterium]
MHSTQEKLLKAADASQLGALSLRKIGEIIGEPSAQKIHHHLTQLQKKGLLRIDKRRNTIERVRQGALTGSSTLVSIPIFGSANCGPATIVAEEQLEGYLKISSRMLKKTSRVFAIKADGHSMNRANVDGKNIEDGDYVIVDSEVRTPQDNDIVVSVIDDMANIKRYKSDAANNCITLLSDSTREFPPIYIHEDDVFTISGKVIQVIKKPQA